jgi:uncharacterized delta-60 repeat protein
MLAAGPARAVPPGWLDSGFGDGVHAGWVQIDQPVANDSALDVAVDAQGRILLATMEYDAPGVPLPRLRRFLADGSPDTSFASSGVRTVGCAPESFASVQVAVSGNEIFVGTSVDIASLPDADFFIEKLDEAGHQLEAEVVDFALGGGHRDYLTDLAVASGRLVAVGAAEFWNNADYDAAIAVLDTATLHLDPTFSGDGKLSVFFDLGGDNYDDMLAVTFDAAGRIVVAGRSQAGSNTWLGTMARILPNGTLDPAFSTDGRATYAFTPVAGSSSTQNELRDVLVDPIGVIWAVANVRDPRLPAATVDAALVRVFDNGLEDLSWATAGWSLVDFDFPGAGSATDYPGALMRDSQGRFLIAVDSTSTVGPSSSVLGLARLTASGALDPTFGVTGDGRAQYVLSPVLSIRLTGAALDAQDRALLCGSDLESAGTRDAYVARALGDLVFRDGLESGSTAGWSSTTP